MERTTQPPRPTESTGKIDRRFFEESVKPFLGARDPNLLVGPRFGVDAAVIEITSNRVGVLATDPFFVLPELGWDRACWYAVQIVASDIATSGFPPSGAAITLNLPIGISDADLREMWLEIHQSCSDLGISIATGHTGRYEGCSFPTVGAMTLWGEGDKRGYLSSGMARVGDSVIVTKGAAIETTALFGVIMGEVLVPLVGESSVREAIDLFRSMSVVTDALASVRVGVHGAGVTSMHDAAEGGVWRALFELAAACGHGMIIDRDAILVRQSTRLICEVFGLDPYTSSSSGTLLITCTREKTSEVIERLHASGIPAVRVGEVTPDSEGVRVVANGREEPLSDAGEDRFWAVLSKSREGRSG